jgi:hypothetical protein
MNTLREQISQLIQDAHDGNESAAKAYAILKELKDVTESGLKVIMDEALAEAREFNKGDVYYGGLWEVRRTATYLDFSKDEVFTNWNKLASDRKKELNQAWKAKQEGKFYVTDEGEEIPILPVKTPSKETLIYKPK